ncbi:hypothetical protein AAKU52_001856 [Pedobacter sp. CG_S7]|uniref:hypothetical protein n=1 Tax=Pedobacter sp. CG_S7 TaxID=3143930 RepID=UPI0033947259
MNKIYLKFLYLIASLNYPNIRNDYKYFIRDNYFCKTRQLRYYIKDYLKKSKYKTIEFQGEFDQELRYVLPFAYWHHLNGTLKKTISSKNTKDLYFFSNDHEERHSKRVWELGYDNFEIPNMTHNINFSYLKWVRVPLKTQFKNDIFKYEKPILIIANKYNLEWDELPINYLSISLLESIINKYSEKYQIIYNRPLPSQIVSDNSEILDLNEYEWLIVNYPQVLLMNNLYLQNIDRVNNFNHLQLLVYANCEHFISAHGGTAAFASYFEGNNIILSKRGMEHELNEFNTIFPSLSGAKIHHAKTDVAVHDFLEEYY